MSSGCWSICVCYKLFCNILIFTFFAISLLHAWDNALVITLLIQRMWNQCWIYFSRHISYYFVMPNISRCIAEFNGLFIILLKSLSFWLYLKCNLKYMFSNIYSGSNLYEFMVRFICASLIRFPSQDFGKFGLCPIGWFSI